MRIVFHQGGFHLAWEDGGISCPVRDVTIPNLLEVVGNIYEEAGNGS